MSFTHNSQTADSEPAWSDVDKTRLPDAAFANRKDRKYPHHWVKNGGDPDDNGRYTTGTMYLHRGGLNAAWRAAHGARSGQDAPRSVVNHLQAHRRALGIGEDEEQNTPRPRSVGDIVPQKNIRTTHHTGRIILQPTAATGRREYDCIFMQPGRVKQADQQPSNWLIPADAIRNAESLFNSIPVHLDHPEMFGFGWHQNPAVATIVGVTCNARWDEEEQAMTGRIRLYDTDTSNLTAFVAALLDQILADKEQGLEVPPVGLSAVVFQDSTFDEEAGLRVTTALNYIESVDIVYDAGAGGYVRAALSAIQPPRPQTGANPSGGTVMPEENENITPAEEAPQSAPSPPAPDQALAAQVAALAAQVEALSHPAEPEPEPVPDPVLARLDELTAQVQVLAQTAAQRAEDDTIEGMGQAPRLIGARTGLDDVQAAFQAMVDGVRPPDGIRPLTGIRELYTLMSGDYEMAGIFHDDRVYLANVTASTMAQLVANVLNKRVMNLFQQYPRWWEPFVSIEDFATLQQVRWITLGGVGELPTVSEGAAYTELTWDDLAQRTSFVKKGGYLGLTIEAIDKDDTRKITAAPRALAQAAWLTLSKSISNIFTANSGVGPNIYYDDSNTRALFHTSNGNLGTSALSWSAWDATRTAMRKQTELNSSERLGALTAPRFLLVPPDLETTALQILASEGEPGTADNDENPFAEGDVHSARMRAARRRVIVVDLWTDANNWAAVADPNLWATIGLGFRYGRTPEVFSVADPRAGLMFTNDTMPIKVRFFYATGPVDYRGLYKHNVS